MAKRAPEDLAPAPYRRGPEDLWRTDEAATSPVPARRSPPPPRSLDLSAAEYDRRARVAVKRGEVMPTPERLTKGDITATVPRGREDDPDAVQPRVRRDIEPIFSIKSLSDEEKSAGAHFGRLWRRATREVGAIDYADIRTGRGGDGLSHSRCEALDAFKPLFNCLADTHEGRIHRTRVLLQIAGERRTMREAFGTGRGFTSALHLIVSACQRIVRELSQPTTS